MAKCRSDNTEKKQRNLIPYKPGQSGNPKGRPKGSRNKLTEEFIRDLANTWETMGKAALMTVAWTSPAEFVRVVASLMPRDVDVTVTNIRAERMTSRELESLIEQHSGVGEDPFEAQKDSEDVFRVGEKE